MPFTLTQLANEINADPTGLGYAAFTNAGNDQGVVTLINAVGVSGSFQVPREPIPTAMFIANMDPTEFAALTNVQLLRLQIILSGGTVDINGANTRASLLAIFPSNGVTKTNIAALLNRQGSRAEVLWGIGTIVTTDNVSKAMRGA